MSNTVIIVHFEVIKTYYLYAPVFHYPTPEALRGSIRDFTNDLRTMINTQSMLTGLIRL